MTSRMPTVSETPGSQGELICDIDTGASGGLEETQDSTVKTADLSTKATLKEFSENTTLHGFSQVVRQTSRCNSLSWKNKSFLLITLCCLDFAGNNVLYIVEDYLRYPMTSEIHTERRTSVKFPAVTICNTNKLLAGNGREEASIVSSMSTFDMWKNASDLGTFLQDACKNRVAVDQWGLYWCTNMSDWELWLYNTGHTDKRRKEVS